VAIVMGVLALWAAGRSNKTSDDTNERDAGEKRFAEDLFSAQSEAITRLDRTAGLRERVIEDLRADNDRLWAERQKLARENAQLRARLEGQEPPPKGSNPERPNGGGMTE
jgi:hypothetical protein